MQKIMFEHRRFGLEQAVIARLKENTRRRVRFPKGVNDADVESAVMGIDEKGRVYFTFSVATDQGTETVDVYPKYQIGERVAVAQSYENIPMEHFMNGIDDPMKRYFQEQLVKQAAAYKNKLFAVASLMPHVIEITNIKAERLQDISNEDCTKEGIYRDEGNGVVIGWPFGVPFFYTFTGAISKESGKQLLWTTRKEAFSELINSINGRGTWNRNEWQFAYTFKLIK